MTALGVDPGDVEGAAVLARPEGPGWAVDLVFLWWRATVRSAPVHRVAWAAHDGPMQTAVGVNGPCRLGQLLAARLARADYPADVVAVEDTFVGKSARTAILSSRWAGGFAAGLEVGLTTRAPVLWTPASEWRPEAFGVPPFTRRDAAKAATLAALPPAVEARVRAVCEQAARPLVHAVDAAGIALWAAGLRAPSVARVTPKRRRSA